MAVAKRIILFLVLNILVVTTISFILYLFGVQPYLTKNGLNYTSLAIFCFIWGMGGAFISLALSKVMAKWTMGVQIIDPNTKDPYLRQILDMVYSLCKKAGLKAMPEVGIYNSPEVNAFATGPSQRHSLVAISSGLLKRMNMDEVEGVIGHEVSHIANGDMVTMTLLQGVVNAFVMFFARIVAFAITRAMGRREDDEGSLVYNLIVFALQICFMILGSIVIATFTRYREYRADAGGATLAGPDKMINSLITLKKTLEIQDEEHQQPAFQSMKISSSAGLLGLFATHPPLDQRIDRLRKQYNIK